jgi:hypothetical protein
MKPVAIVALLGACLINSVGLSQVLVERGQDTYLQLDYSHSKPIYEEICPRLKFVRISENGVVVMQCTSDQKYFVYASPGEYLRGECGNTGFKVVSINCRLGTAKIEYLHSTKRPKL